MYIYIWPYIETPCPNSHLNNKSHGPRHHPHMETNGKWKENKSDERWPSLTPFIRSFTSFGERASLASFAMQWREKLLGHASRKDGLNLMPFGFRQYPQGRRAYYDHFHKVWFLVMCNKFQKQALVIKEFCINSISWMRLRWLPLNLWYFLWRACAIVVFKRIQVIRRRPCSKWDVKGG